MAHSLFHFSLGLGVGTCALLPAVIRDIMRQRRDQRINADRAKTTCWQNTKNAQWKSGKASKSIAAPLAKWLVLSYMLGCLAMVPNLLRRLGTPEYIYGGWWMNLFFLHPFVDRIENGGMLIGEVGVISCFAVQYLILLATLRRCSRPR